MKTSYVCGALAAAILLIGCGVPIDSTVRSLDNVPGVLLSTTSTTTTTTVAPTSSSTTIEPRQTVPSTDDIASTTIDLDVETVELYFVSGDGFVRETELVPRGSSLKQIAFRLIAVPEGMSGSESTLINPEDVKDIQLSGGIATVDVDPRVRELSSAEQRLFFGQLVLTVANQKRVGQVAFTVNALPQPVSQGDGTVSSDPLSADSFQNFVKEPLSSGSPTRSTDTGFGSPLGAEPTTSRCPTTVVCS